jgi:hypothetical protein
MLAFNGAEITDERWRLKAIFRTSKTQEDVQRRNVYPLDQLTISRPRCWLAPFPPNLESLNGQHLCLPSLVAHEVFETVWGTGTVRTEHSHKARVMPVTG